jgi:thioredoxin-related protein
MKRIVLALTLACWAASLQAGGPGWLTDLEAAKAQAKKDNKLVLIDFTGSDWCGWCIKLNQEVFSKPEFQEYAQKNLVLVELDFPNKKPQSDALKAANRKLKEQFKVSGFPTLVGLNADGKELWKQVGYLSGGPPAFIGKIEQARKKGT